MESLDKIKLLFNKKYISVILFIVLDIVFIVFIGYLGFKIYGVYSETRVLQGEIDQMKASAQLIQNNKNMLERDIEEYNALLDKVIPDEETYFQVISAFEQLEAKTGVSIESYSINLSETTEEKMSLNLSIAGTQRAIESLFQSYQFAGGRLMTNEEFTYNHEDSETISFSVNLFHTQGNRSSSAEATADALTDVGTGAGAGGMSDGLSDTTGGSEQSISGENTISSDDVALIEMIKKQAQ